MPEAKNRLHAMAIEEVSLVAHGDNPLAKVELLKAAPRNPTGEVGSASDGDMPTNQPDPMGGAATGSDVSGAADGNVLEVSPEVAAIVKGIEDEVDALAEQNRLLHKILAGAGIDLSDPESLAKAAAETEELDDEDLDEYEAELDPDDEDDDEDGEEGDEPDSDVGKLLKSNPALAALFEAQQEQLAKAQQGAEMAAKVALFERDQRLDVEFAKRAEALKDLGAPGAEVASVLKRLHNVGDNQLYSDVEALLAKGAHAAAQSVLFKETGSNGTSNVNKGLITGPDMDDLFSTVMAKSTPQAGTAAVVKSREQQFLDALEGEPSLYDEWDADRHRALNGGIR